MSAEFSPLLFSSDVPTPFELYYTSAPSFLSDPTPAPTPPYPINTFTPQNPNEVPIIRFVVYLSCTIMILAFILYLNKYVSKSMSTPHWRINMLPTVIFVILLSTIVIFEFSVYNLIPTCISWIYRRNPPTAPATSTTTGSPDETSQNQVDLVKSMSAEERKEYVTNFLKTQVSELHAWYNIRYINLTYWFTKRISCWLYCLHFAP
jgi:hypothetical protein